MLCERCQSKDAAVRMLDVKWSGNDHAVKATQLCLACARASGIGLPHAQGFTAVVQLLAQGLLPAAAGAKSAKTTAAASDDDLACPHCGWTLRDLRQTNRFGCPRDYEVFGEVVEDLLERLQGQAQHCDLSEESALDRLAGEMREAVRREDYEAAARMRDQLRTLEASLEMEDTLD
jgi:protein arginine kinase activator